MKKVRSVALATLFLLLMSLIVHADMNDAGQEIESGKCTSIELADIPVGYFSADLYHPPLAEMSQTQKYNTSHAEGFLSDNGVWLWQHDGWDLSGPGTTPGVNSIFSMLPGIVVYSEKEVLTSGWGESIIVATRVNQYSEEIITIHYHHLHNNQPNPNYVTYRRRSRCEIVNGGDYLAKEGTTGYSIGAHLHLGVRRWKNLQELKTAIENGIKPFLGHGYGQGINSRLAKNLDPKRLYHDAFADEAQTNPNLLTYVKRMRNEGFEFGHFDGRFGATDQVKRREAARWIKIAAQLESAFPTQATFNDVPLTDSDSPYIEALLDYPKIGASVLNPNHSCNSGGKNFCPDQGLKRAEALKMVVLAFYGDEYLQTYNNNIWKNLPLLAYQLLGQFGDVYPLSWYAPYVYFGAQKGIVAGNTSFNPDQVITREQLAKWVIKGYDHKEELLASAPCGSLFCTAHAYCDDEIQECADLPECVPDENGQCNIGGGYDPCENPQCAPGQQTQQSCNAGNGYQVRTCSDQCQWGAWGTCIQYDCLVGNTLACGNCGFMSCKIDHTWGACQNEGICAPGEIETDTCNGTGTEQRTCGTSCTWGNWSNCSVDAPPPPPPDPDPDPESDPPPPDPDPMCDCTSGVCCDGCDFLPTTFSCKSSFVYQCEGDDPGDDAERALVRTYCSGSSASCNGTVKQFDWQTIEDCSSSQLCAMNGGVSECAADDCTDTYTASATEACYTNTQSSGSPTLCVEVAQNSGSSWEYRVCKEGGTFVNDFTFWLVDDNNDVIFSDYAGSSGSSCTAWKDFSVSYIPGYGSLNGAGVRAKVTSPYDCTLASCQYHTGSVTITKTCN